MPKIIRGELRQSNIQPLQRLNIYVADQEVIFSDGETEYNQAYFIQDDFGFAIQINMPLRHFTEKGFVGLMLKGQALLH
jgi:hypothetical protein